MAEYEMLWITDNPISSAGKTTIRKKRKPYDMMVPGDTVLLVVTSDPDRTHVHMVEQLVVKSVAEGYGGVLVDIFADNSHSQLTANDLHDTLSEIYGDIDEEWFMAITFQ